MSKFNNDMDKSLRANSAEIQRQHDVPERIKPVHLVWIFSAGPRIDAVLSNGKLRKGYRVKSSDLSTEILLGKLARENGLTLTWFDWGGEAK